MKNKLIVSVISLLVLSLFTLPVLASSLYYDDGSDSDNPNVDKFVPSSGVKIKESGLARMMENATRDAMDSSKEKKTSSKKKPKSYKKNEQNDNPNGRSYKWF